MIDRRKGEAIVWRKEKEKEASSQASSSAAEVDNKLVESHQEKLRLQRLAKEAAYCEVAAAVNVSAVACAISDTGVGADGNSDATIASDRSQQASVQM